MEKNYDLAAVSALTPEALSAYIQQLINTDFAKLVFLLYRLDISETKLKQLLANNLQTNAGELIAALIVDRLAQKKLSREQFKQAPPTDEADRW